MATSHGIKTATTIIVVIVFVALVLAGLSACDIRIGDPGPGGEVGVSLDDGRVLFRVNPCDTDALVEVVDLRTSTGKAGKEGDLLWEMTAEKGSQLRDYEVGRIPEGFVEGTAISPIQDDREYVASVKLVSTRLQLSTAFVPGSLQESLWLDSTGDYLTNDEFEKLRPCD